MVVQWLRISLAVQNVGLISGPGTKILHMLGATKPYSKIRESLCIATKEPA